MLGLCKAAVARVEGPRTLAQPRAHLAGPGSLASAVKTHTIWAGPAEGRTLAQRRAAARARSGPGARPARCSRPAQRPGRAAAARHPCTLEGPHSNPTPHRRVGLGNGVAARWPSAYAGKLASALQCSGWAGLFQCLDASQKVFLASMAQRGTPQHNTCTRLEQRACQAGPAAARWCASQRSSSCSGGASSSAGASSPGRRSAASAGDARTLTPWIPSIPQRAPQASTAYTPYAGPGVAASFL